MNENFRNKSSTDREREFSDKKAVHYDSIIKNDTPVAIERIKKRAQSIINGAAFNDSALVLELGCGTGEYTKEFEKENVTLIAMDISPKMAKVARTKTSQRVHYVVADASNLPFKAKIFDAVIGNGVLHHIPDLNLALKEIKRIKTKPARIVFREPNLYNPSKFIIFGLPFMRFIRDKYWSPNEKVFSKSFIMKKLTFTDYSDINIVYIGLVSSKCPKAIASFLYHIEEWVSKTPILRAIMGSMIIRAY